MTRHSIEPIYIYIREYGLLSSERSFSNKQKKQLLDTGLDAQKAASKKLVHKSLIGIFRNLQGNRIVEKTVKPKHAIDKNSENVKEISILPE